MSFYIGYCYRLRLGNQEEVQFMVDILPGLITDFLPPMDAMNTVVAEIISQQQTRPWLAAIVMNKVRRQVLTWCALLKVYMCLFVLSSSDF